MAKFHQSSEMQEAIIQLREATEAALEQAIQMIEEIGGRVLQAYPPSIIVALLPGEQINQLRGQGGIKSVDAGIISALGSKEEDEIHPAITAWNDHLNKQQNVVVSPDSSLGLSWDTPGRLPPDPPPDVKELLRRREQELESKK